MEPTVLTGSDLPCWGPWLVWQWSLSKCVTGGEAKAARVSGYLGVTLGVQRSAVSSDGFLRVSRYGRRTRDATGRDHTETTRCTAMDGPLTVAARSRQAGETEKLE